MASRVLDMAVSVGYVDDLEAAIRHINMYGSGHTDAILTTDEDKARILWLELILATYTGIVLPVLAMVSAMVLVQR